MNTNKYVMQQALDALENGEAVRNGEGGTLYQPPLEDAAISALRAAIAQPTVTFPIRIMNQLLEMASDEDSENFGLWVDENGPIQDDAKAAIEWIARHESAQPVQPPESKSFPGYELKFIMRVLGHKGQAPREDWETAYGMAKQIFEHWCNANIAQPVQLSDK